MSHCKMTALALVATGALTGSEAEELLARLRTVIDQAIDLTPLPG